MNPLEILKILAAIFNVGFGVFVIWQPETIAQYASLSAESARGRAELRIAMGGFFIGMGIGALLLGSFLQQPEDGFRNVAYQVVGFAWIGGAVTRLLNLILEDHKDIADVSFWTLLASELIPGIVLIMPV